MADARARRPARRGARWASAARPAPAAGQGGGRAIRHGCSSVWLRAWLAPAGLAAERAQSLVVVGPTQSGKTTSLAVPAILGWRGPVLAASVKSDLLRHTLGACARRGRVWCIDPTGCTGARPSTWSPLTDCARVAPVLPGRRRPVRGGQGRRDDRRTASSGTPPRPRCWRPSSSPRRSTVGTMADVVRWVDTQEVGEVAGILERPRRPRRSTRRGPRGAATSARAARSPRRPRRCWRRSPIRRPAPPAHDPFEPRHLLEGRHTRVPVRPGPRPAPAARLLHGAHSAGAGPCVRTARRERAEALDPPLLVVLDEAAHIAPLPELDGLAATCASHGIQLVTSGRTWPRSGGATGRGRRRC